MENIKKIAELDYWNRVLNDVLKRFFNLHTSDPKPNESTFVANGSKTYCLMCLLGHSQHTN